MISTIDIDADLFLLLPSNPEIPVQVSLEIAYVKISLLVCINLSPLAMFPVP